MGANPSLGGPVLKDDRPIMRHPSVALKERASLRDCCLICGKPLEDGDVKKLHHICPKSFFKAPKPDMYYRYGTYRDDEGTERLIYMDGFVNLGPLCPLHHHDYTSICGQIMPTIAEWKRPKVIGHVMQYLSLYTGKKLTAAKKVVPPYLWDWAGNAVWDELRAMMTERNTGDTLSRHADDA